METAQALRFFTRLPVPALPFEADPHAVPDFTTLPRVLAVAGALIGLPGALALLAVLALGLAPGPAAAVAVAVLVILTGCFSEDGLADTADGLFGGTTRERRLEIMRDSRVGSYGVTALALAVVLRIALLAGLVQVAGAVPAACAIVASQALSRVAGVVPLWVLPPARSDGRSAAVGRPTDAAMRTATLSGVLLAVLLIGAAFGLMHAGLACLGAAGAAFLVVRLARRMIGGQTGDLAGATQQLAEIAVLLAASVLPVWWP